MSLVLNDFLESSSVVYASETVPLQLVLSNKQAYELREIGIALAGKKQFWGYRVDASSEKASVVSVQQVGREGNCVVTFRNVVGVVAISGLTIYVEPKIPRDHFYFIAIAGLADARIARGAQSTSVSTDFINFWFSNFLRECEQSLKYGEYSDYLDVHEELATPRGIINVSKTYQNIARGNIRISCSYSGFGSDNSVNRILKAALRMVANSRVSDDAMRKKAAKIDSHIFAGTMRSEDLRAPTRDLPARFERALSLAKAILASEVAGDNGKKSRPLSFLLPTPVLIETGLRNLLRQKLGQGLSLRPTGGKKLLTPTSLSVNPDLVLSHRNSGLIATGDVKYQLITKGLARDHLYQATTFAVAFKVSASFVIPFQPKDDFACLEVPVGDVKIISIPWCFGDSVSPEQALGQIVTALQAQFGVLNAA
jgi:5-methylcytosine-specific restriction enzyme subunit McrC